MIKIELPVQIRFDEKADTIDIELSDPPIGTQLRDRAVGKHIVLGLTGMGYLARVRINGAEALLSLIAQDGEPVKKK